MVKAIVLDSISKQPLEFVTVAVLKIKDTSLLSYTITDKNGAFTLRNLSQNEPSRLLISYVGYESLRVNLNFKKDEPVTNLGQLYLTPKTLKEVTIKGDRVPVIIKKDTIEFNAEAFKVRPNALVEDLLKKLPGVQVDHSGTISVNGKDIAKIKVDGKDFFANDPKIATRNLDASLISKVQVYDDRENDPDHLVPDYQVKKIINLKFKKALKNNTSANMDVAAGSQEHYDAKAFYARFQDKLQISATGNSNNLNGTGTFIDGLQMPLVFGGQPNSGLLKQTNMAVNLSSDLSKKLKLDINYEFHNDNRSDISIGNRQQFVGDTTFNTLSKKNQHDASGGHNLTAKAEWKPDTLTVIKYEPNFGYSYNANNNTGSSSSSNNFIPLLTTNISSDNSKGNVEQYQHTFNYYRKLSKKGASLSFINNLNINPDHSTGFTYNDLISYTAALQSDTLNRSAKTTNNTFSAGLTAAYHYPFNKKFSADISLSSSHNRNEGDLLTYQQDLKTGLYTIYLQDQSSDLVRNEWIQTAQPQLTYQFTDNISIKAGLVTQLQQIGNHFSNAGGDLNQRFIYVLPTVELHFNKVNINYSEGVQQPGINDLQPITIVYSQLFSFIGNPDLKPTRKHNFNVNYFDFKTEGQVFISLYSRVIVESNSILRERSISSDGVEVTTPINRNGRFTTYLNANFGKNFKKQGNWELHTSTYINGSYGHNFFEVNHQDGYQNTRAVTLSQDLTASWKDILELRPAYSISPALTTYQLVSYKGVSYTTQSASMAADLRLPEKMTWSVNYSHTYNPLVAQGFQKNTNLLSLTIARHIQKQDKGEIRFTCYDLLNQSISTYHFATENTVVDGQNQALRRYFLLSYKYRISVTNSK
ncbi:MAG: outer membrane beta-barrel protein [Mucilaginibacter sp.]